MNFAKLIIFQPDRIAREVEIVDDVVSIGRALDNTISLDGDTNISRYHAEIEKRGDDYYLTDLNSSNGTTINDEVITEEILRDEDQICLGGSTFIEFYESDSGWNVSPQEEPKNEPAPVAPVTPVTPDVPAAPSPLPEITPAIQKPVQPGESGSGPPLLLIAVAVGAALLLVSGVAVLIYSLKAPKCNPSVTILNPASGTTISDVTTIRVEVKDQQCIARLIYEIDGRNPLSVDNPPYEVTLDPKALPDLDPGPHKLSVIVEDKSGTKISQDPPIVIGFESSTAAQTDTPPPDSATESPAAGAASTSAAGALSLNDVRELCIKLAKEFTSNNTNYRYDMEFLSQVQARTREYARQGFSARARRFRDVINPNFIDQKNLDQPLGYVLAMSRSNFDLPTGQGRSADSDQGLWKMSQSFAERIRYNGPCGTETISDPSQRCAALVAAAYAKELVIVTFKGDFVYGVACFSMDPKDAGAWANQLPSDRGDFWKVITRPEQRDRVVRFFAAGIVGENPERFNLPQERKLSSLYPRN